MTLDYAVERLYETGWTPQGNGLEKSPDGRWFPAPEAVKGEFAAVGLELSIKHHLMFNCYHATWRAMAGSDGGSEAGTVVGATEQEAAVYALAQLRAAQVEKQLVGA